MKKQTMITLALALTLTMPTLPAFAQRAMSKDAQGSWVNLPNALGTSGHYLIVTVPDFSRHFLLYKLER